MALGRTSPDVVVPLSRLAPEQVLRRLELLIVRRLEGFLHGEHFGLLPGPGTEAGEARIYSPGEDDVRRMDWPLTARTAIPHVRDAIADRELETWALVDLSPSMYFGTAAMDKRDLAIAAVATLGLLPFKEGDRFGGYLLSGGRIDRWPVRPGRPALFALVRSLLAAEADRPGDAPYRLADAIEHVAQAQRQRGLRIVVSDFLDPGDAHDDPASPTSWEQAMRRLAARSQVVAVEVVDPCEMDLPNVGVVLLQDPETGAQRELDTGSRAVRERYAAAARVQRERHARSLRRAGAAHLVLRTDRDWVSDTARFALRHRRVATRLHSPVAGGLR